MTDGELLLAMSDLLDTKLKAELQPIRDDIHVLKGEMQEVKSDIRLLKKDVQMLKSEMQEVKGDIRLLKKDVQTLKGDVQTLKCEMQSVKTEIRVMKTEMQAMKTDLCQVKLYQENILEPRLNTIEACYTSTYDRYKKDAERMETAFADIEILKRTVENHSIQLQRLA